MKLVSTESLKAVRKAAIAAEAAAGFVKSWNAGGGGGGGGGCVGLIDTQVLSSARNVGTVGE